MMYGPEIALPLPPQPIPAWAATLFSPSTDFQEAIEHAYHYFFPVASTDELEWRRIQVEIQVAANIEPADSAIITFDLINYTSGNIDPSWTQTDYDKVWTEINNLFTAYRPFMNSDAIVKHYRAYTMKFHADWAGSDPNTDRPTFAESGPPASSFTPNVAGQSVAALPRQMAFSVTEETPRRQSWGRFYMPFPGNALLGAQERWLVSAVDTIVAAVHQMYQALSDAELFPVVPQASLRKARIAALSQVVAVRADDVPDVIRRRRLKHRQYLKRLPVETQTQQLPSPAGS